MKISKEVQVGVLALVSGVVLYMGFNFLKGQDFFSSTQKFYAVYSNIAGLTESNPVTLNGKAVGKVLDTRLMPERNNQILVTFEVSKIVQLTDSSIAKIDVALLGGAALMIDVGRGKNKKKEGDTIRGFVPENMLASLQSKATPLIDSLEVTMLLLNKRLQEFESVEANLNGLLKTFDKTGNAVNSTIAENRMAIRGAMQNLNTLSAELNDAKTGIKPLMGKFNAIGDSLSRLELSKTLAKADQSVANLNKLLSNLDKGQGSLGKLLKSDSLHLATIHTIANLDSLFVDLKANPKRYVTITVFGKKEKKPAKKK
ncbi:MAG: MCE family protein [Verrucomicrobia bacterium]|nr:MCE family protein [Cytophagales bacterium]